MTDHPGFALPVSMTPFPRGSGRAYMWTTPRPCCAEVDYFRSATAV